MHKMNLYMHYLQKNYGKNKNPVKFHDADFLNLTQLDGKVSKRKKKSTKKKSATIASNIIFTTMSFTMNTIYVQIFKIMYLHIHKYQQLCLFICQ